MRAMIVPLLALLVAELAEARPPPLCRAHPERVGACRTVHGRLFVANGTPSTRIWVVGTRRILGVREYYGPDGGEVVAVPAGVRRALGSNPFLTQVYGDFEICPLSRQRRGWMQSVCVASARRLHARRR